MQIWYNMRRMHRILVGGGDLALDSVELRGDAAQHIRVLRPKDAEDFELFDGCGASRVYRWDAKAKTLAAAAAVRMVPRPRESMELFACVTKGQRWDWTLQKATELGAAKIVPVISARTIVRIPPGAEAEAKRERWAKIAAEAARQSDALWLPEIVAPVDFGTALDMAAATICFAGALTEPPSPPMLIAFESARRSRGSFLEERARAYSIFVGPEGDFTPDELGRLLKVAHPANFGPSILRAETAAIFGLSVLSAAIRAIPPK